MIEKIQPISNINHTYNSNERPHNEISRNDNVTREHRYVIFTSDYIASDGYRLTAGVKYKITHEDGMALYHGGHKIPKNLGREKYMVGKTKMYV